MCVIATKYFPEQGWVAAKCRDRSYKPDIYIKQSFRSDIERCLLWDDQTKWTEGVNEFGIAILNTTLKVKKDEKENLIKKEQRDFYSPGGKTIRNALLKKTIKEAIDYLIENEMEGFTLIFTKDDAYLIEAPCYVGKEKEYKYDLLHLDKKKHYVRTNHGIVFSDAGYPKKTDDKGMSNARKSSESRYKIVDEFMSSVKEPTDLLRALSQKPNKNKQLNPLRESDTHSKKIMVTTGQLLIIPSEKTLHYRPIWCELFFDFQKIDSPKTKTYFEVISSRKLFTELENDMDNKKVASELLRLAKELIAENKFGSSGSEDGLKKLIAKFWFANPEQIELKEDGFVYKDGKNMDVDWWKKGRRYYFGKK